MIKLAKVTKTYPHTPDILREVCFDLAAGRNAAVVGPSGSGKSTLLNILGGLDQPDSGSVSVADQELTGLNSRQLAQFRCRQIGFVFQLHHLLPQYSVLENVLIPTAAKWGKRNGAEERAFQLLSRVGLEEKTSQHPGTLSGGECQRVAVVRALINNPSILLADEPTGSLSHEGAGALLDMLLELQQTEGMTLITVTHSRELAARMEKTFELKDGRLVRAP